MTYDTFCIFNEWDLLEIRLNILDPYVDYFVICEGQETFSGQPKTFSLLDHQERFKEWSHKIHYIVPGVIETDDPFKRAGHQKDFIREYLHTVAKDDDIIYFGDVDEIWKPQHITDDKVYNLEQSCYSYYLNNRSSERWVGTVVGRWETFKTNSVSHWRANHDHEVSDAGWHFTNLMIKGIDSLFSKLENYDHCLEVNTPWVRDGLQARIDANVDFLGRETTWEGQPFKMWTDDSQLPTYILENKDKFEYIWRS